ncbi:SH3 domain-containing protein [Sphingobium sp. CR28]|uniref:SH3 domain-containing protein n=1 Tax=Sphingobium sp. CR28 TaxID=3400272 RepID=UPI003FEE3975
MIHQALSRASSSRSGLRLAFVAGCLLFSTVASAQNTRAVPYWVALKSDEAKLRVGPSQDFPAKWLYRLPGLPLRVVQVDAKYPQWRKIEDPDGVQGWMHVAMLREVAAAIVRGGTAELRQGPSDGSKLLYHVQEGAVGRVNSCASGWCAVEFRGQRGYIAARSLWGATDR